MFIQRDYNKSLSDDFKLNIESIIKLDTTKEAVPIFETQIENEFRYILGWEIQTKYLSNESENERILL